MMGDNNKSSSKNEDILLWKRLTKSVEPLDASQRQQAGGRKASKVKAAIAKYPDIAKKKTAVFPASVPQETGKSSKSAKIQTIDAKTHKKLARKRLQIDGVIDLHGLTRQQAFENLSRFIHHHHHNNSRYLLVITGKGHNGGDGLLSSSTQGGILKRHLPEWLHMAPLNALITGFGLSHISHGGEGAYYVRLRRNIHS